ncbi:MAG: hypothetical protein QNJ13_05995 [Paracoccaceae bacterium]|nr:hypothetical protein [Paracoccaceae bacterium]
MTPLGPAGATAPLRPSGDAQPPPDAAANVPSAVSGSVGNAAAAADAETNVAVDPLAQSAAAVPPPKDETNEAASLSRSVVEPARADAEMLLAAALDEDTLAGPPPTFDLSILEKTRALGSEAPSPAPEGSAPPAPQPRQATEAPPAEPAVEAAPVEIAAPAPTPPEPQASAEPAEATVRPDPTPRGAPDRELVPGETA